jgi:hypothetical protein
MNCWEIFLGRGKVAPGVKEMLKWGGSSSIYTLNLKLRLLLVSRTLFHFLISHLLFDGSLASESLRRSPFSSYSSVGLNFWYAL